MLGLENGVRIGLICSESCRINSDICFCYDLLDK